MVADEPVTVDADELLIAYEMAEASEQAAVDFQAFISVKTGKVYTVTGEDLGFDDDDDTEKENPHPHDLETSDEYLSVPGKRDLGLGRDLVFAFAEELMPTDLDDVRDIFRRKGAYGRFKDILIRRNKLEAWHKFEEERTQDALRQWCEENGLLMVKAEKKLD